VQFGEVIAAATFGSTGYIGEIADLAATERIIVHNLPLMRRFASVVIATNYADVDRDDLIAANHRLWRAYVPGCILLDSPVNRGHSIGTADLENMLFEHCRAAGGRWLCKSANDVSLTETVFDIPVQAADFYFLNAVAYGALRQHGFDRALFTHGFFFPQSTFFAIDVTRADHLYDSAVLQHAWEYVQQIPSYNGRIWEYLPGWSVERLLRDCVLRNRLHTCQLMSDDQWQRVLDLVIRDRIEDCSFKGLSINGICHTQGLTDLADATVI
jgi:hypothetical protein